MKTEFGDTLRRTLWRYEHSAKTDMDLRKMAKTLEVLDSNLRLLLDLCSNQEHYDLFDDFFAIIKAKLEGDNKNDDNNDSHMKPYIISVKLIGLRSNLIKTKSFLQHLQDKVRAVYERSVANKKTLKSKSNKSLQVSPP